MRKQGKRRLDYGMKPKAPVLVLRGIDETNLELRERMAVEAFRLNAATDEHFCLIQDVLNLLLIAGQSDKSRGFILDKAEADYKPVIRAIKLRFEKTGKWGVTGEELLTLRHMIAFSRSQWMRMPAELLVVCQAELSAFYRDQQNAKS